MSATRSRSTTTPASSASARSAYCNSSPPAAKCSKRFGAGPTPRGTARPRRSARLGPVELLGGVRLGRLRPLEQSAPDLPGALGRKIEADADQPRAHHLTGRAQPGEQARERLEHEPVA